MYLALPAIKEKLERKFALISDIESEADFFLEICNYLYSLTSDMRLSPIIARILHERDLTHETFNGLQQEALNRLREIRKGLQDLLRHHDMSEAESQSLFEKFDKIDTGIIHTSNPLWDALEDSLCRIFLIINDKYPKIQLDKFATKDRHGNIVLAPSHEEILRRCREEFELLNLNRRTAIWGAWERLLLVYQAIYISDREWRQEIQKNLLSAMGLASLISEMKKIISGQPDIASSRIRHFKKDECLLDIRRLHNFVLDSLDKTSLGFALIRKYKQRCEWYDRENLLKLTEKQTDQVRNQVEVKLTRRLARYLHDNGVVPLSQVILGSVRPDLLGLYSGEELFPIEVKVIRLNEKERLRFGFNQILQYLRTIDVKEGFYIVFCRGDFTLDIPDSVLINDQRINLVTIDLFETPPSQRPPQIWRVTEEDLKRT